MEGIWSLFAYVAILIENSPVVVNFQANLSSVFVIGIAIALILLINSEYLYDYSSFYASSCRRYSEATFS